MNLKQINRTVGLTSAVQLMRAQYLRVLLGICIATFYVIQANAETVPGDFDWGNRKPTIYHPQFPIKVTLTKQAKDQIQQADIRQKNMLNQAIRTGNAFMQQHLDGTAYRFDPDYLDWTANTGSLVALSGAEWEKYNYDSSIFPPYAQLIAQNSHWSGELKSEQLQADVKHISANWLVCSQVKLTGIQTKLQGLQLTYETTVVGLVVYKGDLLTASIDKKGISYTVRVELNQRQRINNIFNQDVFGAGLSAETLHQISIGLSQPKTLLRIGDTLESITPKLRRYQEIYDTIKPAMQSCQ